MITFLRKGSRLMVKGMKTLMSAMVRVFSRRDRKTSSYFLSRSNSTSGSTSFQVGMKGWTLL